MFELGPMRTADLAAVRDALARLEPAAGDPERIDQIRLLEELKGACAAAQALATAAFVASQRERALGSGVPAARAERGITAQLALARRISPHRAARDASFACILTTELPGTFGALQRGTTSEWRALLLARETAWLPREHRAEVDRQLAPRLPDLGDRRVEREARRLACQLDPAGAVAHSAAAVKDRRVTLRPAPDTMARLTALLPVKDGVAAYAALIRAADQARAAGDPRTRGQVMADTLVQRLTGSAAPDQMPVEINLVMCAHTLLGGADAPAHLEGGEPIPAPIARHLALHGGGPRWLRRLFRAPDTGELVAMESRRRRFTTAQQSFIRLRDHTCRTPYCDAAIRQIDHVIPHAGGGPTSVGNAAGLCEPCNRAKQAPGWSARPSPLDPSEIVITTPTGHEYRSRPPDLPGGSPPSEIGGPAAAQDPWGDPSSAAISSELGVRAVTGGPVANPGAANIAIAADVIGADLITGGAISGGAREAESITGGATAADPTTADPTTADTTTAGAVGSAGVATAAVAADSPRDGAEPVRVSGATSAAAQRVTGRPGTAASVLSSGRRRPRDWGRRKPRSEIRTFGRAGAGTPAEEVAAGPRRTLGRRGN
jgi:hypothetical protein